jgi:hypothetical protein
MRAVLGRFSLRRTENEGTTRQARAVSGRTQESRATDTGEGEVVTPFSCEAGEEDCCREDNRIRQKEEPGKKDDRVEQAHSKSKVREGFSESENPA